MEKIVNITCNFYISISHPPASIQPAVYAISLGQRQQTPDSDLALCLAYDPNPVANCNATSLQICNGLQMVAHIYLQFVIRPPEPPKPPRIKKTEPVSLSRATRSGPLCSVGNPSGL